MLRQEVVQYVYQHIHSGHSTKSIRDELKEQYSPEDIDDAFKAAGISSDHPTQQDQLVMPRILLFLVVAVLIGAVLGGLTYGIIKLREKAYVQNSPAAPDEIPSPQALTLAQSAHASNPSASSAPANSGNTPSPGTLPAMQSFSACAQINDQDSSEAKECRAHGITLLTNAYDCNQYGPLPLYEECSRAFYEKLQKQGNMIERAQQPS